MHSSVVLITLGSVWEFRMRGEGVGKEVEAVGIEGFRRKGCGEFISLHNTKSS